MFHHYGKLGLRTLLKFKGYAIINLAGLSLGLTAGILILMYIADEVSFDRFHTKADRIFRVQTSFVNTQSGGAEESMETNGWPIGKILQKDFPEVESVLYTRSANYLLVNDGDKRFRQRNFFVSPEFFDIFSFPLKKGNPRTALRDPFSIVISEDMEKKFFPHGDALNQTLVLADTLHLVVTGVMVNMPANSHIQADMLLSFSTFVALNPNFRYEDGWGNINMRNYVLLKPGTDAKAFAAKARPIYMERAGKMMKEWGVSAYVVFAPLLDVYLSNSGGNGMGPVGSLDRLYLVGGIAVFVILLACINFINLATARSVYRAKEVGLRKVVGSTRRALVAQFLSESFVLTALSFVLAITVAGLFLPAFNSLLGKSYSLASFASPWVIGGAIALVVLVTLLSGYYPAVMMSSLRPVQVLKGKLHAGEKGINLRRVLVVFQFVISICLVAGTLVVLRQLEFMQKEFLGFAKDEILVINAARVQARSPNAFQTFEDELRSLALVEQVTFANTVPGNPGWVGQVAYPEGRDAEHAVSVEYMAVDENYVNTLGLEVLAGRNFDARRPTDLATGLVLNQTAVSLMGWASPEESIGKKITSPSGYPAGEVIGVVKNYHQLGLQQPIGPMVMDYNPASAFLYAVRYKGADSRALIDILRASWSKNFPGYDFNYFFLDQDFERQYQSEQRLANVFELFAGITVIIAIIGLVGLVSFMVTARTKEIGMRKVLGAGVFNIVGLLSREFILLVLIANVIAFPAIFYFTDHWLQKFAYRMTIGAGIFVITALIAGVVTLLAVGIQTVRAALSDPVRALRYE
jgi:putative ABC transport system permease protein